MRTTAAPDWKSPARSVSVYLRSPVWGARAVFDSKVDGFVPETQFVDLRMVGKVLEFEDDRFAVLEIAGESLKLTKLYRECRLSI